MKYYFLALVFLGVTCFCRAQSREIEEVLIIHHSHLDIGFTHLQPVMMELQKDYIDEVLDMLDSTSAWPEISRPKWTCEVTVPVTEWFITASGEDKTRFRKYAQEGRIGISALEYNTTSLANAESLIRQLIPAKELEQQLGIDIKTVNIHDITGLPWSVTDIFRDSGIELFTMAINLHLSGTPKPRPGIYRWKSPSGNELLVMNGEHYSMFDQWLNTSERCLDTMQAGLKRYTDYVTSIAYPYDFVYLSATNAPFAYDNAPPNIDLPGLVKQWNDEGRKPRMRFVTPRDLLARIKKLPRESIPVVTGDWTDFWNFGAASSAWETKINLNSQQQLRSIDLLYAFGVTDSRTYDLAKKVWKEVNLFNEHTWGAWNILERNNNFAYDQWTMKAYPAQKAKALSKYVLTSQLEKFAGNPVSSWKYNGVVVINPTGSELNEYIWLEEGIKKNTKHLSSDLYTSEPFDKFSQINRLYGPVFLKPYSWNYFPFNELQEIDTTSLINYKPGFIESPYYRLKYNPCSGKIFSLFDKTRGWEILDTLSQWGFFQFVHERPDPSVNGTRSAFHVRSVRNERIGLTGWKPDWKAEYSSIREVECIIKQNPLGVSLIIRSHGKGIDTMEQRLFLSAVSPLIDLSVEFIKKDVWSPEGLYFAFPLNLDAGWEGYYDTGSIPVKLDEEQLPGSCKGWVTVNSFASVHNKNKGVVLYCPDAPLVQIGNFNFGRNLSGIERKKNPLLLSWPLNNYWETNYRGSQPGFIELNYAFASTENYQPFNILRDAQVQLTPPLVHPVETWTGKKEGRFIDIEGKGIIITAVRKANEGNGIIVRLLNLNSQIENAILSFPGKNIRKAWLCSPLEDNLNALDVQNEGLMLELDPRRITSFRIVFENI